jgi:hypothetical protein
MLDPYRAIEAGKEVLIILATGFGCSARLDRAIERE